MHILFVASWSITYILIYFGIFLSPSLQINEMTKELDALLAYIEKDGGFRDACITFQQRPLSMFEDGLQNLLELLQVFKVYHNCERPPTLPPSTVCLWCCPFISYKNTVKCIYVHNYRKGL